MKKVKRNKAFWGSLIGAGISAAANLIGSKINATNQEQIAEMQYNQQKQLLERQDIQNEYNQKLQNQIAEQENEGIYDELRRRNYKNGGKIIKRKKAENGFDFTLDDAGAGISSLISGIGSLGSIAINNGVQTSVANMQMKLAEDKFNSEANKYQSYAGQNGTKNLRKYLTGEDDGANLLDSRKSLYKNSRLYLS